MLPVSEGVKAALAAAAAGGHRRASCSIRNNIRRQKSDHTGDSANAAVAAAEDQSPAIGFVLSDLSLIQSLFDLAEQNKNPWSCGERC